MLTRAFGFRSSSVLPLWAFIGLPALALACVACDSGSERGEPNAGASAGAGSGGSATNGSGGTNSTAAGGAGSGGVAPGASGGTGSVTPPGGTFDLLFRDDFEQLDLTRWQLMTHSWDTNLALFSAEAAKVENGELVLALTPAPSGTVDSGGAAKSFFGAEVRSTATLKYGRVRARLKLAKGPAVVSALVTIYTPWPADNWNELDIEYLGAQPSGVQFNTMVYTGTPTTPPVTTSVSPTQEPKKVDLGFDASADFHVYGIEWTPERAVFSIDDEPKYTWTNRIELMNLPQNVLLTIWASSSASWAGAVGAETGKATARYDWVELYNYTPTPAP